MQQYVQKSRITILPRSCAELIGLEVLIHSMPPSSDGASVRGHAPHVDVCESRACCVAPSIAAQRTADDQSERTSAAASRDAVCRFINVPFRK